MILQDGDFSYLSNKWFLMKMEPREVEENVITDFKVSVKYGSQLISQLSK